MLIQEGILISVFFAAILSLIVADRIFKSQLASETPHLNTKAVPKNSAASDKEKQVDLGDLEALKTVSAVREVVIAKKNTAYDF